MNGKAKILTTAMVTGICIAGSGMASGLKAVDSIETNPLVLKEFDRIHIETPVAADLAVMNVRVFGPDNELLLSTRTMGDSVDFLVDSGLPDGEYRYETVSIFSMDDVTDKSAVHSGDETMVRNFGSFTVSGGEIIQQDEPGESGDNPVFDEASIMDKVIKHSMRLAGLALDVLVPSAQAANLVASSGDPGVIYDDTDLVGAEWVTFGNTNSWGVADQLGNNNHWVFRSDGTANSTLNIDSMIIDPDGDIHWGSNGLNYDRGGQALSLGTTGVRRDVTISSLDPAIDLFDESTADSMGINYDGLDFSIYTNSGVDAVKVNWLAPADSLHIQGGSGHVGLGTSAPVAPIHVQRDDGNAKILVEETNVTTAARSMFELYNNGPIGFNMFNTNTGETWRFAAQTVGFRISLDGSGGPEFELSNTGGMKVGPGSATVFDLTPSGNLTINGTLTQGSDVNSKRNIDTVNGAQVLMKLAQLPISEWSYKSDDDGVRHLGPMAQDFHAAFGLGATDTGISSIDTAGVALAAIQALVEQNLSLEQRVHELEQQNQRIEELVMRLVTNQTEQVAMN